MATAMNTVMRTLGGAFGAQVAATCITSSHGLGGPPSDGGFTLALAVCATALAAGVVSALAVPGRRPRSASVRTAPAGIAPVGPVAEGT